MGEVYNLPLPPPPYPLLPVPNKPCGFCGRWATCLLNNNNKVYRAFWYAWVAWWSVVDAGQRADLHPPDRDGGAKYGRGPLLPHSRQSPWWQQQPWGGASLLLCSGQAGGYADAGSWGQWAVLLVVMICVRLSPVHCSWWWCGWCFVVLSVCVHLFLSFHLCMWVYRLCLEGILWNTQPFVCKLNNNMYSDRLQYASSEFRQLI